MGQVDGPGERDVARRARWPDSGVDGELGGVGASRGRGHRQRQRGSFTRPSGRRVGRDPGTRNGMSPGGQVLWQCHGQGAGLGRIAHTAGEMDRRRIDNQP